MKYTSLKQLENVKFFDNNDGVEDITYTLKNIREDEALEDVEGADVCWRLGGRNESLFYSKRAILDYFNTGCWVIVG